MSRAFLDLFPKGVVINLPERTDRRAEIEAELAASGAGIDGDRLTLFAAVRPEDAGDFPSIGARGCFMSHLEVLRAARDQGLESLLILEDDAHFGRAFAGADAVADALKAAEWDIFYAGYTAPEGLPPARGPVTEIPPGTPLRTTHAMALKRGAIAEAVPYLEALLSRPAGAPEGGPMHVDGAYSWLRRDRPDLRTLAATPQIVTQRSSRSDITPRTGWRRYLSPEAWKSRVGLGG